MIVVGAGETKLSAGILFATLGIEVLVVDDHMNLLNDGEMFANQVDAVHSLNIALRLEGHRNRTSTRFTSRRANDQRPHPGRRCGTDLRGPRGKDSGTQS